MIKGAKLLFGFSKHVPNIQTKKKKFDWVRDTYNAHQQRGGRGHFVCLLNHKPICSNGVGGGGGPGGCDL